ncbi:hypothetical protein D3C76_1518790 [compost metagenome]
MRIELLRLITGRGIRLRNGKAVYRHQQGHKDCKQQAALSPHFVTTLRSATFVAINSYYYRGRFSQNSLKSRDPHKPVVPWAHS